MSDNQAPAADLFGSIADIPEAVDVLAGIELLRSTALWSPASRWPEAITAATAFARRWHAPARTASWSDLDLWGANSRAPGARLSSLGAGWLVAKGGYHVLEVAPRDILVATKSASRLRISRPQPDADAALAWLLCRPA
jgi:hypothetical protein